MLKWKHGLRLGLVLLCGAVVFGVAARVIRPRLSRATTSLLVPLELVLLVDTSESVDASEYQMQKQGYVHAFRNDEIAAQIERMGGIAVVYIEWDDANNHNVRVPWTLLRTAADCTAFSNEIQHIGRVTSGTTMMAPALAFAKNELETNEFMGLRRVIDVSGDGLCKNWNFYEHGVIDQNQTDPAHYGTTPWADVIASLAGAVDNVNGVFIGPDDEHLEFYENVLPQGNGAFSFHAAGFAQFEDTLEQKIMREVCVPIPGTYD